MIIPEIKISVDFDKKVKKSELYRIGLSQHAADLLRKIYSADTFDWVEESILLCLNNDNRVLGFYKLCRGGVTQTIVDTKIVFTLALNCPGCTQLILSHNHPSGNLQPSPADITLTKKILAAGQLLDIKVMDHIIITDEKFFSFCDEGLL